MTAEDTAPNPLPTTPDVVFALMAKNARALLTLPMLAEMLADAGRDASTDPVNAAVEKLRSTGRVDLWEIDPWRAEDASLAEEGPYLILSHASAASLGLVLVEMNVNLISGLRWTPYADRFSKRFAAKVRRAVQKDVEEGRRVEDMPDRHSPNPARDHDDHRPDIFLGERLQWNGPAWADGWRRGRCPSCEGNREVHQVLVEHGQMVWADRKSVV